MATERLYLPKKGVVVMKHPFVKRVLSMVLCAAMLLGNFPAVGYAAEADGLCAHHTEHVDCGYIEGESSCGFVCELCAQTPAEPAEPEEPTEAEEPTEPEVSFAPTEAVAEPAENDGARTNADAEIIASGECGDNLTWTLDAGGTITISGTGPMWDFAPYYEDSGHAPWFDYSDRIVRVIIGKDVTSIGRSAFRECLLLEQINFPEGVTYIGEWAFMNCSSLHGIILPDSLKTIDNCAFGCCSVLTEIVLPEGLEFLGRAAFASCSIKSIVIPEKITNLHMTFCECSVLEYVSLPSSLVSIGSSTFRNCTSLKEITLPSSVVSIDYQAFRNCTSLEKITMPSSLLSIGEWAFINCISLKEVTLPSSVASIGEWAFRYCVSLREIALPERLQVIENGTFAECTALVSIGIPKSVTHIEYGAFKNCSALTNVDYYGTQPDWTRIKIDSENDYLKAAYSGIKKDTWTNDPEKHKIIVVDAEGTGSGLTPVVGANVYVGSEHYVTDQNGRVEIDNFGTQDVLITADNYREMRTIYTFRKGSGCIFPMEKKRDDNLPYFIQMTASDAPGVSVDLRYDSFRFTKDDGRHVTIRLAGNWQGHGEGSFTLYQLATQNTKGKTLTVAAGTDIVLYPGTQLNPNVPVWVKMTADDGTESEPVKLNLYIHPKTDYDGKADNSLDVGEGSLRLIENQDLQTDNQLINDILALNASLKTELIPFTVTEELNNDGTHTVKVLIGAFSGEGVKHFHGQKIENLTEEGFEKKNYWQDFVDLFDKKKSKKKLNEYFDELKADLKTANAELKSTKFQHFAEMDMDVAGYFTYVLDSEGRMIGDPSGGIMGIIDGKVVFGRTFIAPTPIPFPYFFETEIGGNLELSCDLQLTQDGKLQPVFSVPVEAVLPQASLQGGLGARNIATAGVGGGFEHHIFLNKTTKGGYCTANAFINLKLLKIVDWKVNFANSGPFLKWGVHQTQGYRNLSDSVEAHYVSAGELTLTGRNYLANSSGWNGAAENTRNTEPLNVLQYGVMPDGTPQIHQLGDQQIALFVRDVASRSVGNHTQLVYTVRRNGVWSEPKAVWDHETADLCFDSAVVNGKLYVAWQKSSAEMTGEDPEALLDSVASASEICVAVWDPAENAFTGQRFVTDDKAMDMLPSIYASGNNVVVAWAKSGESKVFDTNSACSIHRIVCINGTWGEAETLQTTGGFIWELAAGSTAAGESILYIAGDASGRQALYCLQDEKVATLASEYNVGGLDFHNGFFAWHTDSGMYTYSGAECKAVKLPDDYPIPVTAKYVENQQQRALVWVEGGETNKIVAGIYSDGAFQKPITLVDGITEDITFMDVLLTDDNVFSLIVTTAIHNGDGYESTALCVARASLKTDARLEYADVDQADWETGKQLLRFRVINEGAYPITELTITATSGENTLLEKVVKAELQSGESSVYTEYLDISRVKGNTDITVSIHAAHDDNSSNDTASVSIGYTDVRLELDAYEYEDTVTFVLTARNVSAVPADVSIRVTGDRADGAVLHEKNIGTVTRDNTVQYVYTVKKAEIDFGGRSQKPYFFTAVVSGNDWSEVDDSCLFCITSPVTQQENPDGEMEEIEVILPEGISVSPENLVIDGLDGESVQLIAAITPTGALDAEVQWEVADADVVRVDSKGRVTPLQAGTTTITARISDAIQTTVTVTVKEHVHTLERIPTRGSSCTVQGNMLYYVCSDCGKWFLDSSAQFIIEDRESVRLPLADHSYGREWSADAANHWHVCSCGEKSALEAHVPGAEPTETAPQLCTVCGWELKPAIVHTHNPQKVDAKEATHTESGNKEYYICSCGNWYEDAEGTKLIEDHADVVIPKFELGDVDHNHKLTSMDAMLLMQYKAGLLPADTFFCEECADVNGKTGVNSIDAMLILQFRAGLITSFR